MIQAWTRFWTRSSCDCAWNGRGFGIPVLDPGCVICCESSFLIVVSVFCFTLRGTAGRLDADTLRLRACGLSADPVSNVAHWLPWCCRKWENEEREGLGLLSFPLLSSLFHARVLNHTFTLILTFSQGCFKVFITLNSFHVTSLKFLPLFRSCSCPVR